MRGSARLIAVDGGGSRCRFLLAGAAGEVRIERGPANVFSDFDGAVQVLREGLSALEHAAGVSLVECPACLALAGVIDRDVAARVALALPLGRVRIEEDWRAALEGALGGADGAVVGLGTGSFAARLNKGSATAIGGHGLALGDEASGAWMGREALRRALHAAEGLAETSPLTEALLHAFGGVSGIVSFGARAAASDFAALAPQVAEAGREDRHAAALLTEGAEYVSRALAALGWSAGERLCLTGGLSDVYRDWLAPNLGASLVPARGTALDGALAMARAHAGESA